MSRTYGITSTLALFKAADTFARECTFDAFSQIIVKAGGDMQRALQHFQQFRANPLHLIAEIEPRTVAVELVEVICERAEPMQVASEHEEMS